MFHFKLFLFIIFLLFGEVSETTLVTEKDTVCQDWYLSFPTKFHCLEYYKHHGNTKPGTTTSTVVTTSSTTTTTSTTSSTWTLPDFETTVSPPFTAVTKISTTLQTSTMTSAATNSAQNKTPWFLSLWAVVIYR